MFEFVENIIEERKYKKELLRKIEKEINKMENESSNLSTQINGMRYIAQKIKVIEGAKEEFEKEYDNFMKFVRNNRGQGILAKLNSIYTCEDPEFLSDNLITKAIIKYSMFELKEGIELTAYKGVVNEYVELQKKIEELSKKRAKIAGY